MDEQTREFHRRAIRATAKVALSFTVAACGAEVVVERGSYADEGREDSLGGSEDGAGAQVDGPSAADAGAGGASETSRGAGQGGAMATCDVTEMGGPVELDRGQFDCCAEFLSLAPEDAWFEAESKVVGCCLEVTGQLELDPSLASALEPTLLGPPAGTLEGVGCCQLVGAEIAGGCSVACGCTVWGPSVPPEFGGLWSLALLEVA